MPVPRGRTALFIAAAENHPDLLHMLLEAKANVDSVTHKGLSLRELVAWGLGSNCYTLEVS